MKLASFAQCVLFLPMHHLKPLIKRERAKFTLVCECNGDYAIASVYVEGTRAHLRGLMMSTTRRLRKETQQELAARLQSSYRTVVRLEAGCCGLTTVGLADIEEALGQKRGAFRI